MTNSFTSHRIQRATVLTRREIVALRLANSAFTDGLRSPKNARKLAYAENRRRFRPKECTESSKRFGRSNTFGDLKTAVDSHC